MSQARVPGILGVAVLVVAAAVTFPLILSLSKDVYAQATVTPIPDNAPVETAPLNGAPEQTAWGDVKAGAPLAGACAACHGLDGNPTDPQYPRIAGQSERYIAHQIALYKSGERNTGMAAVMKPFADALSAQDARNLGAYFATQKSGAGVADDSVIASGPNKDKKFFEVGQQLFRSGDMARGIPACMACHGPDGAGNPGPAYPHLAGQQAAYEQRRLEEYRAGTTTQRDPHLFNIMATIAKQLTDEEIGALASYLQGLHPRADEALAANVPAAAPPAAAPVPAPPAETVEATPATGS